MGLVKSLCKGAPVVWAIYFILCVISVIEVFSASSILSYGSSNHWGPFTMHCITLVIGLVIVLVCHRVHYRNFRALGLVLLPFLGLVLMVMTLYGALVNNAARWLNFDGLSVQPSEIAKFSVVVFVAAILVWHKENGYTDKRPFRYILVGAGIMCALIFRENFSTAAILFATVYCMMFIGKIPAKQMLKLTVGCLALVAVFLIMVFAVPDERPAQGGEDKVSSILHRFPAWRDRIVDFVTPVDGDPADYLVTDDNRQTTHANITIASSNFIGCGPGNSVQRDFLSHSHTDFIYAIIIEELGLAGGIVVFLLYFFLLINAGRIARQCDKPFPAYLVMGLAILMTIQAVINMAVAVGLFPVTGQTLPLISKGGSSIVMCSFYFGIILSVSRSNDLRIARQREEAHAAATSEPVAAVDGDAGAAEDGDGEAS